MNIYNFIKSEIIEVIDQNIEYLESFDDLERACYEHIEAQYYSIYWEDAEKIFVRFFHFFYSNLKNLSDYVGNGIFNDVTNAVSGMVQVLTTNIIQLKSEAIGSTLKSPKLSTEEKKMQLIALIDVAAQELSECEEI